MGIDLKYGEVVVTKPPGTPLGAEEPVFLIRAKDRTAADAVRAYADIAERAGAQGETVAAVRFAADLIVEWQRGHADDVEMPD